MPVNKLFVNELKEFLPERQFFLEEGMARHTTFQIGGPADYLIYPATIMQVQKVVGLLKKYNIEYTILGNGSNVLVRDKGIRGAVVKFSGPMSYMAVEGDKIIAGAGAHLKDVSEFAAKNSLTGMEFAVGIPGSIGGAAFMNAGAYDGEMKKVITLVRSVDAAGNIHEYKGNECEFGYRHSIFQENGQFIAEVEISLAPGDKKVIEARMAELTEKRESKQPLEMPSAGSTFKRPEGYYAGTLIDQTGLKGFQVGGAQISTKHAGFVVNAGGATATDVLNLIKAVQEKVYEKHGVKLFPEVRIIGEA